RLRNHRESMWNCPDHQGHAAMGRLGMLSRWRCKDTVLAHEPRKHGTQRQAPAEPPAELALCCSRPPPLNSEQSLSNPPRKSLCLGEFVAVTSPVQRGILVNKWWPAPFRGRADASETAVGDQFAGLRTSWTT